MTYILFAVLIYLLVGFLFSIYFIIAGAARIDPHYEGSHRFFKLMLIPGSALLWPVLLRKIVKSAP